MPSSGLLAATTGCFCANTLLCHILRQPLVTLVTFRGFECLLLHAIVRSGCPHASKRRFICRLWDQPFFGLATAVAGCQVIG